MQKRNSLLLAALVTLAILLSAYPALKSVEAQTSGSAALTGQITSQEEGAMEGVLISAKRAGSTVTLTVVSDQQGHYTFPRARLEEGRYALHVRAVGYDLVDPGPVDITPSKPITLDLKLRKTGNLAAQLSNTEWLLSVPGTQEQKLGLMGCVSCHSLERIVRSQHDPAEWVQTLLRMSTYYTGSTPLRPQRRQVVHDPPKTGGSPPPQQAQARPDMEGGGAGALSPKFLASINLSSGSTWEFPLKTLPRPKGRATRVMITKYDLPRPDAQVHDAIVDREGMVWYTDFGNHYVGKLDPKTAKVVEYLLPDHKPNFPFGSLDVEVDKAGDLWFGMMVQGGIAKFDKKTQMIRSWKMPSEANGDTAQVAMVMPWQQEVDGKVWSNNVGYRGLQRLEPATGKIETIDPYLNIKDGRAHTVYGIGADSHNNLFFNDINTEKIGRVDAKTLQVKFFDTPTHDSAPRRGHMDSQDRWWFAEFRSNKVAVFDTKAEHFQEWTAPTPWTQPYDVMMDKNGELWEGGMTSDRILRLDPKSGQFTEYLIPTISLNIRRVFVDNSTNPVTFWVGDNHNGAILKVEPLD